MTTGDADPDDDEAWRAELARYRAAREQRVRGEWGWLSLVARFVLSPGDNDVEVGNARIIDGDIEVRLGPEVDARDEGGRRITVHRWRAGGKDGGRYFFVGARHQGPQLQIRGGRVGRDLRSLAARAVLRTRTVAAQLLEPSHAAALRFAPRHDPWGHRPLPAGGRSLHHRARPLRRDGAAAGDFFCTSARATARA